LVSNELKLEVTPFLDLYALMIDIVHTNHNNPDLCYEALSSLYYSE